MYPANSWTSDNTPTSNFSEGKYDSPDSSPLGIVIPGYPVTTNAIPIDPARWIFSLDVPAKDFVVFLTPVGVASLPSTCGIGVYVSITHPTSAWNNNTTCPSGGLDRNDPTSGGSSSDSAAPLYHYVGCLRAERPSGLFSIPASLIPDHSVPLSAPTGSRSNMISGIERNGKNSHSTLNGNSFSFPVNGAGDRSFFPSCTGQEAGKNSTGIPVPPGDRGTNSDMAPPAAMVIGLSVESIELLNSLSEAPLRQQAESAVTKVAIAEKILENFYSFVSSYGKVLKPSYFFSPPSVGCSLSVSAPMQMYDGITPSGSVLSTNGVPASSPYGEGLVREREAFLTSLFGTSTTSAVENNVISDHLPYNGTSSCSLNSIESSAAEFIVMPMNFVNKWRERLQKNIQKDRTFFSS